MTNWPWEDRASYRQAIEVPFTVAQAVATVQEELTADSWKTAERQESRLVATRTAYKGRHDGLYYGIAGVLQMFAPGPHAPMYAVKKKGEIETRVECEFIPMPGTTRIEFSFLLTGKVIRGSFVAEKYHVVESLMNRVRRRLLGTV
jgi:hypothetical protein